MPWIIHTINSKCIIIKTTREIINMEGVSIKHIKQWEHVIFPTIRPVRVNQRTLKLIPSIKLIALNNTEGVPEGVKWHIKSSNIKYI